VPIKRSGGPSPGITGQCHTLSRARDDRLGCFASERPQQALHDSVLRRTELFGALFDEAIENCQRGQTGLGRQPALDVGEVLIEHRGILIRFLYGLRSPRVACPST
jgi:hypothetical protein